MAKEKGAFKIVKGLTAFLEGNNTPCKVRRGTLADTKDKLYVDTGAHFRLLTHVDKDYYLDNMERSWRLKQI